MNDKKNKPIKGHWIKLEYWINSYYRVQCSECYEIFDMDDEFPRNKCPKCKADMSGEEVWQTI